MIVNWIGSFSQGAGYSGASEKIAIALEQHGYDIRVMSFAKDHPANVTEKGREIKSKPFAVGDVGICMGLPNAFTSILSPIKIGFTMFETDKIPSGVNEWCGKTGNAADIINKLDMLLVPSEHNKSLFEKSGVKIPIEVVHLGIDPEQYVKMDRPVRSKFTFLMSGVLTLRKNPGAALCAFLNEFKDNDDVRIVFKTSSGTMGHVQMPYKNVEIIDRLATQEEMFSYYRDADAFVFPSRGEGFGLTPLEAMATGLPTIFADNTGMHEYADKRYNFPIVCPTTARATRFPKNWGDVGNWYEVDMKELQKAMRWVYDNRDEAKKIGMASSDWVHREWTYAETAKQIGKIIEKLYTK